MKINSESARHDHDAQGERLVLRRFDSPLSHDAASVSDTVFADDVRRGLTATAKHLPPKYFYDELGSQLFEAICLTPEYYVTRAEDEIFAAHADDIISRACEDDKSKTDAPLSLFELGSGSSTKTRRIIEAILSRQRALHYRSIDISETALERAAHLLLQSYPEMRVTAYAADYQTALRRLKIDNTKVDVSDAPPERTLALFLGSNIGNFSRDGAAHFLRDLRATLRVGDALLMGADLRKSRAVLEAAYSDALGITAAFNLNLLVRINRELGGDFQLDGFRHLAAYDEAEGRVSMYIESIREQSVEIKALNLHVHFTTGERIHTENSHKYSTEELCTLAERSGFACTHTWLDEQKFFSSNLFRAA